MAIDFMHEHEVQLTGKERRVVPRVDVELSVTVESESNFFNGFSENISEGGLFIATHDYKPVGERVTIRVALPDDGETIVVDCAVCWVREYNPEIPHMTPGMGVRFLNLSPWDTERVEDFCASLRDPMFIDLD